LRGKIPGSIEKRKVEQKCLAVWGKSGNIGAFEKKDTLREGQRENNPTSGGEKKVWCPGKGKSHFWGREDKGPKRKKGGPFAGRACAGECARVKKKKDCPGKPELDERKEKKDAVPCQMKAPLAG